jgi:hypothetical protein
LSDELEKYYAEDGIKKWDGELHPLLRNSLKKDEFIMKIRDGKHQISSQLPVPGLRNASIEHSFVMNNSGALTDPELKQTNV